MNHQSSTEDMGSNWLVFRADFDQANYGDNVMQMVAVYSN